MGSTPERSQKPLGVVGKIDPTHLYTFTNLLGEEVCLVGAWIIRVRLPNKSEAPEAGAVIDLSGAIQFVRESYSVVIQILGG